jgi:hypothetical protein
LGETLVETVADMKKANKITDTLEKKILETFDKVISNIYKMYQNKDDV